MDCVNIYFFSHRSNADVDGSSVSAELVGKFQGVRSGIVFFYAANDEGGSVLGGLDREPFTFLTGQYPPGTGPLDIRYRVSSESTGHSQNLA